ncbi:hypothetical protein OG548_01465 [Streptomyces sp. NBC_01356]|uniref:hypothetical protein n=1 Tax=Streptomyces sp. NBC_01356 TaxID=2903836 RepID=UPI002E34488D|nr:hypothetical protein [Streptomyces sp. NBC_01356]
MVNGRPVWLCCGALAGALLLTGCSGTGDGGTAGSDGSKDPTASSGTRSSPAPSPSATGLDFTPDPGRAPKTPAEALRLARAVAAAPVNWGPGFVRRSPYESEPGKWPVLDANCVWEREPLPATVLATLTRYSELPAEDGKGPIRVAAVVTVHRTAKDADWEMAETLEEALRCPDQQLRQGERISDLLSQGAGYGALGNFNSEDTLTESGKYYSDELGGPHYYYWVQSRVAQVTVAVVGRGAEGRTEDEVDAALNQGTGQMLSLVESELEAPE